MFTRILAAVVLMIVIAAVSVATVSLASRPTNVEPSVDLSLPARPQLLEVARINAQLRSHPYEFVPPAR
jgi:hypothetical protein